MIRLIKIEWMKLKHLSTFWVLTGIFFVLLPLGFMGVEYLLGKLPVEIGSPLEFPNAWYYVSYTGSWFNMMLGLSVIILVSIELSNKTMRQNVIDGLSRRELLGGKIILVFIISMICTMYVFFVGLAFGLINSSADASQDLFQQAHYVAVYFIHALGYMSVALLIALLLRQMALSILLFIFYMIFELIVQIFLPDSMDKLLPKQVLENLIPNPSESILQEAFTSPVTQMMSPDLIEQNRQLIEEYRFEAILETLPFALGYIVVFLGLSWLILEKRSL